MTELLFQKGEVSFIRTVHNSRRCVKDKELAKQQMNVVVENRENLRRGELMLAEVLHDAILQKPVNDINLQSSDETI